MRERPARPLLSATAVSRLAVLVLVSLTVPAFGQPAGPSLASGAPIDPYFSPVDANGWPVGHTMETLRGLRACNAGEHAAVEGAPIPCRPAPRVDSTHLAFGVDWTTGVSLDDATSGGAHAVGVELAYAVSRNLQLAGRYEVMGYGDLATQPMAGTAVNHHLLGVAKWRLFTDEVDRDAWTFGAGFGQAFRESKLGGHAPLVRAAIAREIGLYIDDNNTVNAALELAYERALDDLGAQAFLASLRFGFELNVREPMNLGTTDEIATGTHRTRTAFDFLLAGGLGLGLSHSVPVGAHLAWVSSGTYLFGDSQLEQQGFDGASWAVQSGIHLALRDHWWTPYVGAQGGAAWYAEPTGREHHWIATPELGVRLQGCEARIDLGAWLRTDVANDFEILAGGLVARGAFGGCGGAGSPTFASRYVPPPPVATETRTYEIGIPDVTVPDVQVGGSANVAVEVKPVVVEVQLGAALLGGALSVRIDARLLPLDRLRGAGHVHVELRGQSSVLAQYRGELDATVGRHGGRVDAWATVPTSDTIVRAVFTIYPPGTRPPTR